MNSHHFLSSMAHEIRTPLNGILGYSQLLLQTRLNSSQIEYANQLNSCCIQLLELINDMLDYSSVISGQSKVNSTVMSLKEFIYNVSSAVQYKISAKKQRLHIEAKNLPEYVVVDQKKLTQIAVNLLNNANKYSQEGARIILTINVREDRLTLTVEDNGSGISSTDLPKLFQPFVQLSNGNKHNQEGSGLGLFICKKLTELLDGSISVTSEEGEGSIFTVNVKIQDVEKYESSITVEVENLKGEYIIILDDNIEDRLYLADLLFENSMKPIVCATVKEFQRLLQNNHYRFACGFVNGEMLRKKIGEIPLFGMGRVEDLTIFDKTVPKPLNRTKILEVLCNFSKGISSKSCILTTPKKVTGKHVKILIVEDVRYNIDVLTKILNNLGYTDIYTALDGKEGIEEIKKGNYNIVFLDLKMPEVDGFAIATYVRDNGIDTVLVAITASILEEDKNRCEKLGINYFLQKPVGINAIKNVMSSVVN